MNLVNFLHTRAEWLHIKVLKLSAASRAILVQIDFIFHFHFKIFIQVISFICMFSKLTCLK